MIAFGPFVPDQIPVGSDRLTIARNVLPGVNGYRPVGAFQAASDALPDTFLGGASFISTGGSAFLLAGTPSTLSRLASGAWTNLLSGLSITKRWKFTQFGNFAICVNGGATQQVDLGAGTASAISGAPTAEDVDVVGPHVVYTQPNGDILKVRWSAFEDHTSNTLGVDQAGEQPMLTGGEVMGIAGGEYGVILQRQRLVRMSLTGDADAPFQFDEITPNFGCASKGSIATAGRTTFCLSDRGFIAIDDGQSIRPIGNEKFDRSFRDEIGEDGLERIWAAIDPQRTQVMWSVPGLSGKIWVYNWVLDRASTIEIAHEGVFPGFESSETLEGVAATYPDLDAMTFSLDDPRFSGGAPRLYVVKDSKVGILGGSNLVAEMELGKFPPFGTRITRLRAVWPDTDAISGVTVTVSQSQRQGDGVITKTGSNMQDSGRIPLQVAGKHMIFNVRVDNADWSYLRGFELEASAGGFR